MTDKTEALEKVYNVSGVGLRAICYMKEELGMDCAICNDFDCPVYIELEKKRKLEK